VRNRSSRGEVCPSATLSIANPTWTFSITFLSPPEPLDLTR
jgi:hypothetical protein